MNNRFKHVVRYQKKVSKMIQEALKEQEIKENDTRRKVNIKV